MFFLACFDFLYKVPPVRGPHILANAIVTSKSGKLGGLALVCVQSLTFALSSYKIHSHFLVSPLPLRASLIQFTFPDQAQLDSQLPDRMQTLRCFLR